MPGGSQPLALHLLSSCACSLTLPPPSVSSALAAAFSAAFGVFALACAAQQGVSGPLSVRPRLGGGVVLAMRLALGAAMNPGAQQWVDWDAVDDWEELPTMEVGPFDWFNVAGSAFWPGPLAVSYTHLTLPTMVQV